MYGSHMNILCKRDEFDNVNPLPYSHLVGFNSDETTDAKLKRLYIGDGDIYACFKHPDFDFPAYMRLYSLVRYTIPGTSFTVNTAFDEDLQPRLCVKSTVASLFPWMTVYGHAIDVGKTDWIDGYPARFHSKVAGENNIAVFNTRGIGIVDECGDRWQPYTERDVEYRVTFDHLSEEKRKEIRKEMAENPNKNFMNCRRLYF